MKAADVMTRAVITATPRTSVAERAQLMLQHRISGILLTALAWLSGLLQRATCCAG
jgi:CBS domain-containing protein